jgi:hypothetical protein
MPTRVSDRDQLVLATIGRFRMLTRAQVKHWLFASVSEPVVTRFLKRAEAAGYIGVERVGGNGQQLLWLTRKGRDFLAARGTPAADLFPATGPATSKVFAHTVAIGDVASWLARRDPPPDELLPAWAIQRYFAGKLRVIPDLLAIWRPLQAAPGAALAIEVDFATEPVETVFVPKLRDLGATLTSWLAGLESHVLVLVPTRGRAESLRKSELDSPLRISIHTFEEIIGEALTPT